jgi:beta-glucanase (GH16 family)
VPPVDPLACLWSCFLGCHSQGNFEPANTAVWQTTLGEGGWYGTAPAQFNADNVVSTGTNSATLTTRYQEGYNPMAADESTCNFTCSLEFGDHSSGILATTQTFTYGYFEATVSGVAAATGLRTSYWVQGPDGEINIVDLFNVDGTTSASNDFHCWGGANDGTDAVSTANVADTTIDASDAGGSLDGANTYGVLWTSNAITFYVNNQVHRTVTKAEMPCIDAPMQLIISTETAFSGDGEVAAAGAYDHKSTFDDVGIFTYVVASTTPASNLACPDQPNKAACKANGCKFKNSANVCMDWPLCSERTSKRPCKRLRYCFWWNTDKSCRAEAPPPKLHACDLPKFSCKNKDVCSWNNPTKTCSVNCAVLSKWACKNENVGQAFCNWSDGECSFKPE